MIVSFDIYKVVHVIHLIILVLMIVTFIKKNKGVKTYVMKLIFSSGLIFINLAKIPMHIHMDKPYVFNIISIIIWFIYSITMATAIGIELETLYQITHKSTDGLTDKTTEEATDE